MSRRPSKRLPVGLLGTQRGLGLQSCQTNGPLLTKRDNGFYAGAGPYLIFRLQAAEVVSQDITIAGSTPHIKCVSPKIKHYLVQTL